MNTIGNDNYRPGMVPPEPMREGSGWLSSNMAQLMVFLNGLILTVTAYATLSVFIHEIVKDDFLKITNEVQEYISTVYNDVEKKILVFSDFVEVLPNHEKGRISQYAREQLNGKEGFEEVFFVHSDHNTPFVMSVLNDKNYIHEWSYFFENHGFPTPMDDGIFVLNKDHFFSEKLKSDTNITIIANAIKNRPDEYVVAFINNNKLIEQTWLEKRQSIFSLQITNEKDTSPFFDFAVPDNQKKINEANHYMALSKLLFVNNVYDVQLSLKTGKRELFLQKIPLLMLLFGVTLTLIGTLYVRNNQNQSQKLSKVNKELAHKNYELNQEMSERERLNALLQQSAKENKSIINSVSDIIFEIGIDGTLLFLNDSWQTVTGFEAERSLGRNLFDLLYLSDQEEQKENFQQLVKGYKNAYRSFTRLRTVDGKYRTVEIAFSMLRQDENKDLRAVGTIMDVEERRRAERALGEAEKKYRAIVENAASGIYQVTPEGQFLSANPSFAKILGYENPEEILRDVTRAQDELYVDTSKRDKILQDVAHIKKTKNFEVQVKRKNGDVIWVSENIRPVLDDDETLLFYEGSMEDIDQRKKAEIALKEAKIESDLANRAKSEFLTNMSHELRTPLNSVIGFAEIIKSEAFGEFEQPEYKEYAENIHESGRGLLGVINEILDVSRIDAGDRDLKESLVDVKDIIGSCIDLMKSKVEAKQIRIDNKISEKQFNVIGEKHAIKQMVLNLLSNAIRFSPEKSYVMLDAEIDERGRLCVSVTDTGIGLTEEELEKALSPFGQVNTDHSREKSGTGLGLTLVKSLVELHGGSLDIVSQKNIGTTATLNFPEKRVSKSNGANVSAENETVS